jgi:hypothetical protein
MVLGFFRNEDGLDEVSADIQSMLNDARHSFDLAMSAVLAGADPDAVLEEVRNTDQRINAAEQEVRRRLLVHSAVQGSGDIDSVLSFLILSRKIERIGDQAKNILDLGVEGVNLAGADDAPELRERRDEISASFETAMRVLAEDPAVDPAAFRSQMHELIHEFESRLRELMHSTEPANEAVPRALLFRYLKRTVANLAGVTSDLAVPTDSDQPVEDLDE